ncbi:tRNA1(Val) (adenine(37)-N6)-methyltransferase [Polymorphum gilvum]|uniref:Methyltransferase small domain family n=1 Tax=Polymorphum gilvum (strain LMG 25793 / CGMCC 1.9160 / SL003B-26A1) TaxID=991905 RepID=F2J4Z3_POLGS|nr:methyltransferase [Polymorphum gilvum]ADZ70035.1 Methyltransferase small domain family [Polymorphum gilvum SL003B-26A1]
MTGGDAAEETTRDAFLGGMVIVEQPRKGRHRAGLDAVYLAAALPDATCGHVVDLGAGVGTAGMCVAARLPSVTVTLVDRDPVVLDLARRSLADPLNAAFADRVAVLEVDIAARGSLRHAAGLTPGLADHAIMNPPYYDRARFRASPADARAGAHVLGEHGLDPWARTATDIVREGGTLTVIFRADGLREILDVLDGRFGAIDVIPLRPRPDAAATRILVRAVRASRAPLRLMPGFVLHEGDGSDFTAEARAVMRDGAGLALSGRT